MADYLTRMLDYDSWANGEVARLMLTLPAPPRRAEELLAHVAAAQQLWWNRICGDGTKVEVWPQWSVAESEAALIEIDAVWRSYRTGLSTQELEREVAYSNSAGERWSNAVEDILRHLVVHGSYHRGQIASYLRQTGVTPVYTDYIHAVRRSLIP